jgi:hypothetical protein
MPDILNFKMVLNRRILGLGTGIVTPDVLH